MCVCTLSGGRVLRVTGGAQRVLLLRGVWDVGLLVHTESQGCRSRLLVVHGKHKAETGYEDLWSRG